MTNKIKRGRHYAYNINYHIVWIPRYIGTAGHVSAETIKRYIEECQRI